MANIAAAEPASCWAPSQARIPGQSVGRRHARRSFYTNFAMQECDVMFAIGARLDRPSDGHLKPAAKAKIIHVDL